MRDIWNPWHGCTKVSAGCDHCYMYFLDSRRGLDGALVRRSISNFHYPLKKNRAGQFHIRSGEMLRVCMTSDFFLEEADPWRPEAWEVMRERSDVVFFLLTKRPERVLSNLPPGWGDGWANVFLNVSCENQAVADQRIPLLLDLPARNKGLMCAPLIGPVHLSPYLASGQIRQVLCGGENYGGARPCDWQWVQALRNECEAFRVRFCFLETGTHFIKDNRHYRLPSKRLQNEMAFRSGASWTESPLSFDLSDPLGFPLPPESLHEPVFSPECARCSSRPICNGCVVANNGALTCG